MSSNIEKASEATKRAIVLESQKSYDAAIFYYKEAAKYLNSAIKEVECTQDQLVELKDKSISYENRAIKLQEIKEQGKATAQGLDHQALYRVNFLFGHALEADERNYSKVALELYSQTAEYCLKVKGSISNNDIKEKIELRARQAISRGEEIKAKATEGETSTANAQSSLESPEFHVVESLGRQSPRSGAAGYSKEEKRVLLSTSKINGINYVPFMDIDMAERFQYAIPFTDSHGLLKLSPKQRYHVSAWVRPEEIFPEPKMIVNLISYNCIKQTIVSDCSFVASLAVCALYERRFSKPLITPIIFPRNRKKEPIYNPFGKYMVKLHINGIVRKVIIDDQLPVDRHGQLLCSHSTRSGELWVSLLEKAYMKVMGGYDFPGSHSDIDMHALTGWIPEHINIKPNDPDLNVDSVFNMLESRLRSGHCLGTVATGELSTEEEDRTGLVATHAYAILDVVTINGEQLMQLKNPWSHVRWRGNYSELDTHHWTPALCSALKFNPNDASSFDNGIFWIDYSSILHFFRGIYLSWNPDLFHHTYCTHRHWKVNQGPAKDIYNMGENPQFTLHVPGKKSGSVWILLTRHITDLEDFKDNREFIALLVYTTNGSKVYYPHDPPPYIDGIRTNSPHYLTKVILGEGVPRTFTLVVSQYEKTTDMHYTLRAYSTLPFQLKAIEMNYSFKKEIGGQWKGITAGGCGNHPQTFPNNPCFNLNITTAGRHNLLIDLKGPKQYQVGFVIQRVNDEEQEFGRKSSGLYRSGFVVMELSAISAGLYSITPSTYLPNQEGPFILTIQATCAFAITRVK